MPTEPVWVVADAIVVAGAPVVAGANVVGGATVVAADDVQGTPQSLGQEAKSLCCVQSNKPV